MSDSAKITVTGRDREVWHPKTATARVDCWDETGVIIRLDDAANDAAWMSLELPAGLVRHLAELVGQVMEEV